MFTPIEFIQNRSESSAAQWYSWISHSFSLFVLEGPILEEGVDNYPVTMRFIPPADPSVASPPAMQLLLWWSSHTPVSRISMSTFLLPHPLSRVLFPSPWRSVSTGVAPVVGDGGHTITVSVLGQTAHATHLYVNTRKQIGNTRRFFIDINRWNMNLIDEIWMDQKLFNGYIYRET